MQTPQEILKQEFKKRRDRNPNFSLRSFAKWLGISPAQLSQMLAGKRPITLNSLKKISGRLGYSPIKKKNLMNSLLKEKQFIEAPAEKKVLVLQEDRFRIIADWFHFGILSLTKVKGAKADPRWIARRLGVSVEQAHEALLRLERMGIIQTKPEFRQVCEPIEVVSEVPSEAIRKYHKQNLELAIEKIETVPVALREYQSISMHLNPQQIKVLKKHIDDFLEEASSLAERHEGEEVYNLNVQLFPLTIIKENTK